MTLRVFACPECRCRKFVSLNALNVHLSRAHTLPFKIVLNHKGKAFKKNKKKEAKAILVKHIHVRARA
jgi:predicted TIM-barrel fold metal-dependent hydrolase